MGQIIIRELGVIRINWLIHGAIGIFASTSFLTRNTFCGTWYLPHSRDHKSTAELCSNFGDSAITKGQIAYFSLRMRKTALFLLPVKNLTSSSCSPTPISYNTREFWRFGHKYGPNCIFFIAHAQNGLISTHRHTDTDRQTDAN